MPANYTKREYLKVFDTIKFYTPWSIFENFLYFLIQIQILNLDRLGTDRNRNQSGPVRPVPTGLVNHGEDTISQLQYVARAVETQLQLHSHRRWGKEKCGFQCK
jgi:hypothetical protein